MTTTRCDCEHAAHFTRSGVHAYQAVCPDIRPVKTLLGTFNLCAECAECCAPPMPDTRDDDGPAFEERSLRKAHRDYADAQHEQFEDFGRDDWKLGE